MSRNFFGIGQQSYIGQLYALPVQTLNTKFGQQSPYPPTTVAAQLTWLSYGAGTVKPNVNTLLSMPNTGNRQLLDKILSCRIDNLNNPVPVYVFFPDTGYTVAAPPNSIVWEPVQTAQFDAWVVAEGFTDGSLIGADGKPVATAVYLCNFVVPPFLDTEFEQVASLWKASASISRGGTILNQNFGTPALGDQFVQVNTVLQNNGQLRPVFPVLSQGFYYITSLVVLLAAQTSSASGGNSSVIFESQGSAGVFLSMPITLPNSSFLNEQLFQSGVVQWKIDATQQWQCRTLTGTIGSLAGNMLFNFTFTANPT